MKRRNLEKRLAKILAVALAIMLVFTGYCLATEGTGGINNTTLVTGTQKLITDLTNWALVVSPILTALLIVYYLIRKSAADEMDGKRWDSRVRIAAICCIGVVIASGLINVIIGYYQ